MDHIVVSSVAADASDRQTSNGNSTESRGGYGRTFTRLAWKFLFEAGITAWEIY